MIFNKRLVAVAIASGLASTASASTLTLGNGAAIVVPAEVTLAEDYVLDLDSSAASPLGNSVGTTIVWTPSFGLNSGDLITFTATGCQFVDGDYKLTGAEGDVAVDLNSDGDTNDAVEVASNFGVTDVNGTSFITVRVNNGLDLPTNTAFRLTNAIESVNGAGSFNSEAANINLSVTAGLADGGNCAITTSATTSNGTTTIPAAAVSATNIITAERQLDITITAATSEIAITADDTSRELFSDETGGNSVETNAGDTDATSSAALVTVDNDADSTVDDFFVTVVADSVDITVTGGGTADLATAPGASFLEFDESVPGTGAVDNDDVDLTISGDDLTATFTGIETDWPARGAAAYADDLVITVDGTSQLSERTYTTQIVVDYADKTGSNVALQAYDTGAVTSHTWTFSGGGAVLHTPLAMNNDNFRHRVTLTNRSNASAPFSVTAIGEDTCTIPVATGFGDGSEEIAANSSRSLFISDVIDTANIACTDGDANTARIAVTFDVEASTNDIQGIIQLIDASAGDVVTSNYLVRDGSQ